MTIGCSANGRSWFLGGRGGGLASTSSLLHFPSVLAAILPSVLIVLSVLRHLPTLSPLIHLSFILPPLPSSPSHHCNNHNWCRDAQYSIDSSDNNAHADTHFSRTARTHTKCTHRLHMNVSICLNNKKAQSRLLQS